MYTIHCLVMDTFILNLSVINSLNISCLNLRLNQILLNLRNIIVNGPEK
jgi:hypothetical protein